MTVTTLLRYVVHKIAAPGQLSGQGVCNSTAVRGPSPPRRFQERKRTMAECPEFDFKGVALCRPRSGVKNCPQIAINVPGMVAFRDSEQPQTVVTMTSESWAMFTEAVKAGEFDLSP